MSRPVNGLSGKGRDTLKCRSGETGNRRHRRIWIQWRLFPKCEDGTSIAVKADTLAQRRTFRAIQVGGSHHSDQIGLILPTSLCSGQIAQMIANRLNDRELGKDKGISRYVALAHTEGCGVSSGQTEEIYTRTLVGHLTHPTVGIGLLLEHGCEKTHNDHVLHALETYGIDSNRYGWASIQMGRRHRSGDTEGGALV